MNLMMNNNYINTEVFIDPEKYHEILAKAIKPFNRMTKVLSKGIIGELDDVVYHKPYQAKPLGKGWQEIQETTETFKKDGTPFYE
jgi:hypothetical protein